ncbi:hypothetical protein BX666DRAFT_1931046 [Dichotomocladium elegans]|nr:hypothetical protein BX666DRAFT_1931046 [Dichotomocladium elegans]
MSYQRVPDVDDDDNIPLATAAAATVAAEETTTQPNHRMAAQSIEQQQGHELEIAFADPLSVAAPLLGEDTVRLPAATSARNTHAATITNDGVFSNIAAKPESESNNKDVAPPAYDEAAADATPPYWHTEVIAPCDDMLLVEGLPVGSFFQFAWNLMISAAFQFMGFLLTMIFHTTHASKYGSQAGLGVTFVQLGFLMHAAAEDMHDDNDDARKFVNYLLMMCGWFIIIRAVTGYIRVKQMEKIIIAQPRTAENMV